MDQGLEALRGQVLENTYRVTRLIGEGGMGAVYEAEHSRLPRRFAIKVLFPHVASNEVAVERFHREALITSELGHPHIVDVIDFNHTPEGLPYIVMEFLSGEDLEARMERVGAMSTNSVNRILEQTASALQAVHDRDIVHRDLKPQNVFLCEKEGVDDYIKVVDFGISKIRGAGQALTRAHMVMGTPYYMSPEQAKGHADEADRRADIFAVGAMLYEMLTGRLPFQGETPDVVLYQVVHETPASFQELGLDIPPGVEEAVFTAIAKKPEERWDSMDELAEAFANAVERTVIDFSPLDDVDSIPDSASLALADTRLPDVADGPSRSLRPQSEDDGSDEKITDRLKAVKKDGVDPDKTPVRQPALASQPTEQLDPDKTPEQQPALHPGPTEQLDPADVVSQANLEDLGTEPDMTGRARDSAGTAPGLGPTTDLAARTTPSAMPVPDALADTAPREAVDPPALAEIPTAALEESSGALEDDSAEARTAVMDTRALHDMDLLEQPPLDEDEVDTFKEHKSVAAPGSQLDQAYQQGLDGQPPPTTKSGNPLKQTTFSSTQGELKAVSSRKARFGMILMAALLLVGIGLTYGAVRMMNAPPEPTGGDVQVEGVSPAARPPSTVKDNGEGAASAPETAEKPTAAAGESDPPATEEKDPPAAEVKDPPAAAKMDSPAAGEDPAAAPKPAAVASKAKKADPPSTKPAAQRLLTITSSPRGARVVINRKLAGWTPLSEHEIPAGKLSVVISRPGYRRVNRTIQAGEQAPIINIKMAARAKKPELGFLRVATLHKGKPSRAFIFINGKRSGESPLRVSLPAGKHRVEAWRRGVKSSTKRVMVVAGKTELVILKLKKK